MGGYLRRLATTGAAYTASSVLSKLIAVALLPLYTRHLTPADYGAAEVLIAGVIAASIVIRFGVIEALLRFYYQEDEQPDRVVATGFAALFWPATAAALIALPFAGPISEALLDQPDAGLARIAIGGLWVFTLYEYLLATYRVEERARAYFGITIADVVASIPVTVWLVVFEDEGARGLLIGIYGVSAVFLVGMLIARARKLALVPDMALLRRMGRFGFPTMPAELSLYALSFIDRIILVRAAGLAEAGLYALAVKFAQAVNVIVRGFQLAWPPLAYSIRDDDEARRAYSLIVTWFVAGCTLIVVAMWLLARWIVRALAAPEFFDSYEAVGLVSTGIMLYALYFVLVVVLGRTGRTEFNFPATAAAAGVNVALNLALVPPLGIVGAGIALVASYIVALALLLFFSQRLFPIPYEWLRLGKVTIAAAAVVAAGELLLPTSGAVGLVSRAAACLAYPAGLYAMGFPRDEERRAITRLSHPRALRDWLRGLRTEAADAAARPATDAREPSVALEAELRDEDARS